MEAAAEKGDVKGIEMWQILAMLMQGARIALPGVALCFLSPEIVTNSLYMMPSWLSGGMAVGGGLVAGVGYAMFINMMANMEARPFFALGFVFAAIQQLTLNALGVIGVSRALL